MLKTRLLLIGICALVILLIFQLPKVVVENQSEDASSVADTIRRNIESHVQSPKGLTDRIQQLRNQWVASGTQEEKNAIFADSLASLYRQSNRFDSAAWFAEEAAKFFNNTVSWIKAGDDYYQAYTLAIAEGKQKAFAAKAQEFYGKVLKVDPSNLEVKNRMAMTYVTSSNPMQGITMLREVLASDPDNVSALFNMGMLSIQSGQNERAVERLEQLVRIDPNHIQGQLLLGIAKLNSGDRKGARAQFEKVKQMDKDPAVQATVDSYLKDLK
jgi:tetratricopeptide (TPR) repeat protein